MVYSGIQGLNETMEVTFKNHFLPVLNGLKFHSFHHIVEDFENIESLIVMKLSLLHFNPNNHHTESAYRKISARLRTGLVEALGGLQNSQNIAMSTVEIRRSGEFLGTLDKRNQIRFSGPSG